ncbi:ferroxidase fet3 [Coemansia brasiliensis]|uniref:Ferroxidase fet3 n=1 Tax=Coemansia brasiliensis TaxID=2650707 RepID=A0A9W8ICU1_9FUNG|nr:ferroxidase fet3 [Coemansia brasiliensis]
MRCALLSLLMAAAPIAMSKRVELNWDIGYLQANPDGLNQRRVIGVNGKWPPPVIEVNEGDILAINAHNSLDEPTSLHAHGFHQVGTTYFDGVPGVTECGIPPNGTFTYEYNTTQTGTYWLHAHYEAQYTDGLRTPLIIHAHKEPHRYDEDMVLMLEGWYHRNSKDVLQQLLSTSEYVRNLPFRPYMLVNSHGGSDLRRTTLKFQPGKTYRLRLLNVSATGMVRFGIEQHEMYVIEVDGTATEPKLVNNVQLSVGQRVSVLVTAKNTTEANYAYYADIFTDIQAGVERAVLPFTSIVEYSKNAPLVNATDKTSTVGWDFFEDVDLVPIDKQPPPGVNKWVPLEARTAIFDDRREHLSFNNRTYEKPTVPTLTSVLTTGYQAFYPDVYGFKSHPIILDPMTDIEVAIFNMDNNSHPFHLHGHSFFVYRRGAVNNDPAQLRNSGPYPVRRDTITIPPHEFALLRFKADNPGVWLLHCHMAFHAEQGMMATFIEDPYYIRNGTNLPKEYSDNCKQMGIPLAGNAMGHNGLDLPDEPKGPLPLTGL